MADPLWRLEERLRQVDEALEALRVRVARLEGFEAEPAPAVAEPASQAPAVGNALPLLTLVGRTFLVFGGAYLLRALTESNWVPLSGGVVIGFAYASTWMGVADRAAARRPASGVFHGLTSLLIAFPLLLEASTRFKVLSPAGAALALAGFTSVAFGVALHRHLSSLAAIAGVVCSIAAVSLAWITGHVLPFAIAAIVSAAVAEAVSDRRDWHWPARSLAFAANFLVLNLLARALASGQAGPFAPAITAAMLLAIVYTVLLVRIALTRSASVTGIAISLASVLLGLGGVLALARAIGPPALQLSGAVLLMLGVAGYGLTVFRSNQWSTRASAVLTSLAGVLVFAGSAAALSRGGLAGLTGLAAIVLLVMGTRDRWTWLTAQGACFALTLAVTSGILQFSIDVWTGTLPSGAASLTSLWGWLVLALASVALPLMRQPEAASRWSPILTALAALGASAFAIQAIDAFDGLARSPGVTAAERSVVIAGLVMALIALSRVPAFAWSKTLGYAAMILATIKLPAEDLRVSSALSLFVALAAYGTALIVSAKLLSMKARL